MQVAAYTPLSLYHCIVPCTLARGLTINRLRVSLLFYSQNLFIFFLLFRLIMDIGIWVDEGVY